MSPRRYQRRSSPPRPRWMQLHYAGVCPAGHGIAAGETAYWNGRTVLSCSRIEHAKCAGLTRSEWIGSPVSGQWVEVLADSPLGDGEYVAPEWTDEDYDRGYSPSQTWKGLHGRCMDAPCCGCC